MMPHSISSLLVILMILCLNSHCAIAFSSVVPFIVQTDILRRRESSSFVIRAAEGSSKKKRRRRTDDGFSTQNNNNSLKKEGDDDDLPGFDIIEDNLERMSSSKSSVPESVNVLGNDGDNVGLMDVMKGSSGSSVVASAKDLIASRDTLLEATFEFDPVAEPLPRLGKRNTNKNMAYDIPPDMGKKQARSEARRAAALEAESRAAQEERQKNILSSLPILGDMVEEKNQTPVKFLETGAWLGIAILVLWEFYLNSPFFDRAAPMAPVVYQLFM